MNGSHFAACTLCLAAALPALAQGGHGDVFDYHQHWAWQENTGWTNWRWNPLYSDLNVARNFGWNWFGRWVWAENIGWISLGDGTPGSAFGYTNASSADYGVDVDQADNYALKGYAWSENVGWINFGPFAALPAAQRARLDPNTFRLRGYAWGENIGWLSLDDSNHYVDVVPCWADVTSGAVPGEPGYGVPNGILNNDDFFYFLAAFSQNQGCTNCPYPPDITGPAVPGAAGYGVPNNVVNNDDFFFYLQLFSAGC